MTKRRLLIVLPLLVLMGAISGWAYWTAPGSGSASASVGTLNAPTNVSASSTAGSSTVSVSWTASAPANGLSPEGYYVRRWDAGTPTAAGGACGSPSWPISSTSCSDTGVADGTYTYTVVAAYRTWTAESDASNSVTVVNDNTPPTVTVEQKAGQADPTNELPIRFTVHFSESVSDFDGTDVTRGGTAIGGSVAVTGSGQDYEIAVSGLTGDGTVTATIAADRAHDAAGNGNMPSTSSDNTVTYDSTPPTVTITKVNGSAASFPLFTKDNVTSVGGTCGTATAGSTSADSTTVNVSITGTASQSGTATCAAGSWTYTTSPALSAEGGYTLTTTQSDGVGNTGTSGGKAITIDTTPPTISAVVASTFTATPTAGFFKSGGSYVVLANAIDTSGAAVAVTANVSNIAASSPTSISLTPCFGFSCTASNGMTYAYTSTLLTAGAKSELNNPFSFTVSSSDSAGNAGSLSGSARVDNTAPSGGSITYAAGYNTSGSVPITLTKGTDPASGSGIATNGNQLQRASTSLSANSCTTPNSFTTTVATDPSLSYSDATVATGNCYRYQYVVFDGVGNSATYAGTNVVKVDTTVPSVSVGTITSTVSPNQKNGCALVSGSSAWFSTATSGSGNVNSCGNTNGQGAVSGSFGVPITASDPESGMVKVSYPTLTNVTGGGDVNGTGPSYTTTYGWTSVSPSSSGSGSGITGYDNAGLTNIASFSIALDNTAPTSSAPSVTVAYYTTLSVPVGTSATDNPGGSGVASFSFQRASAPLTNDSCGSFGIFSAVTLSGGNDTTVVSGNCYEYQERATDNVGNQGAFSPTSNIAKVDTTSPALTVGSLTGSASPSGCQYINSTAVFYSTTNANSNNCGSASGSFTVPATATDNESGILRVSFPAIDNGISGGGDDTSSPYTSTYSWNSGSTFSGPATVTAYNNALLTGTGTFTATLDNSAPTGGAITANGSASDTYNTTGTVNLTLTNFADAGSGIATNVITRAAGTLSGNVCGSLSGATTVTISSGHDSTTLATGCYRYTLTGTDKVGNHASAQSAIVKVDTTAPSAPAVTLSNATGNTFINGSTLYVNGQTGNSGSFLVSATTSDDDSGILKVNFPAFGSSLAVDDSSSPYQTTYTWSGAVTAGGKTVSATNNAGGTATGSFTVTSDTTAPGGASLTVNSTNASATGSSSYNPTGSFSIDTRTDYTEAQSASASGLASSTLLRQAATLSNNTCGTFGSDTVIFGKPDQNGLADGCYKYTLTGTDNVVNTGSINTTVKVDSVAPTSSASLSAAANAAGWNKANVTVTLSGSDAVSGVRSITYSATGAQPISTTTVNASSTTVTISTEGTTTISFHATDSAGNVESPDNTQVVKLDKTAPTNALSLVNKTGGGSFLSGTKVFYRGSDGGQFQIQNAVADGLSGPASSLFAPFGGTSSGWTFTPSTVSTPAGGPYVSNIFSWLDGTTSSPAEVVTGADVAGNTLAALTLSFTNDSTAPTTTDNADTSWHNAPVTVTLTPSDGTGSGVASTSYQVDSGGQQSGTSVLFPAPASHSNDGTHALSFFSTDNVGNVETTKTATVKIDTAQPSGAFSHPSDGGKYGTGTGFSTWPSAAVDGTASDALSGVSIVQLNISRTFDGKCLNGGRTNWVNCPQNVTASGTTSWSSPVTFPELTNGMSSGTQSTFTATITITDLAGNTATASITFTAKA